MKEYTGFAQVYDLFMDNVPYDEWVKYLCKLLKENGVKARKYGEGEERPEDGHEEAAHPIVCELGCGTGSITRRLRDRGFEMIGIDLSDEMLQIAREKEQDNDESILYLEQDMREFELYGSVSAVISLCDSMNYLESNDDLLKVLKLVNNYLDPAGVFIFDLNTEHYYKNVLGEQTIAENRPEGSFIWENYYDPATRTNEFDMTIYIRSASSGDKYTRFEETHFQYAFKLSDVKRLISKSGLELVGIYEALTHDAPVKTTERVYLVARKPR